MMEAANMFGALKHSQEPQIAETQYRLMLHFGDSGTA